MALSDGDAQILYQETAIFEAPIRRLIRAGFMHILELQNAVVQANERANIAETKCDQWREAARKVVETTDRLKALEARQNLKEMIKKEDRMETKVISIENVRRKRRMTTGLTTDC